jgi:hypothetical protein
LLLLDMGVTSSLKTWSSQAIFGTVMIGYPLEPAGKGWLIIPLKIPQLDKLPLSQPKQTKQANQQK